MRSLVRKVPFVSVVARRWRLEQAERPINRANGGTLYRYEDPETGIVYVGKSRWDPFMVISVANEMEGL